MSFANFLKLLIENKLFGLIAAIIMANSNEERWDAIISLLNALKPIVLDWFKNGIGVSALSAEDVAALESQAQKDLEEAFAAAGGNVSLALGDRLRRLRDVYDVVATIGRLFGLPFPKV